MDLGYVLECERRAERNQFGIQSYETAWYCEVIRDCVDFGNFASTQAIAEAHPVLQRYEMLEFARKFDLQEQELGNNPHACVLRLSSHSNCHGCRLYMQ